MYTVEQIAYVDTKPFIMDIHYAGRMPSISYSYGLFDDENLVGIVSFGSPASAPLCRGICGEAEKSKVIELNRLVLLNNKKNEASFLVARAIKLLPKPKVIVSYADTAQGHSGYVYQACNFLFTGTSKPRTDIAPKDGKHPRHHLGDTSNRVVRSAKHRYVYIHADKREKKRLLALLRYPILNKYPKAKAYNQMACTEHWPDYEGRKPKCDRAQSVQE